jgi:hypothetical protein
VKDISTLEFVLWFVGYSVLAWIGVALIVWGVTDLLARRALRRSLMPEEWLWKR